MRAALVGVMAFRQEQKCSFRRLGVLFRRVPAQLEKGLPVHPLLGLLLPFLALGFNPGQELDMLRDDTDTCPDGLDAASRHLPAFACCSAEFLRLLRFYPYPVRERLVERIGPVQLA